MRIGRPAASVAMDREAGVASRIVERPRVSGDTRMTEERSAFGWLTATAPLWPLGLARILYGILWVQQEIQYPTVTAYKDFLQNVLIPHWTFFGWMTLITETFIAVTLILGLATRLGSLVAIGMAANITIGILNVPHEWGWTYVMLLMLPAIFLLTDAGRSFGVDSWIAPRLEASRAPLARLIRWLV